jgi:glycosyltransferase involved in cell wall biosynthesis
MGNAISLYQKDEPDLSSEPDFTQPILLSIIIPVFNEAQNIPVIYQRICEILDGEKKNYEDRYEILFIDDGSTDGSHEICLAIQEKDPRVKTVQFRRNFGKTAALQAGFSYSSGAYIVSIDCDMQEDPADMLKMLALIDEGYDMVCGWRKVRHDPPSKTIPSRLFNWVVSLITGIKLHDFNCGFKAYRTEVIKEIKLYGELHRFIPVLAYQRGFKVTEVAVEHQRRKFGRSKFGAKRLVKGYLDFIQVLFLTNFIKYPLRLFGAIGTILSAIGVLILLYMSILWFDGVRPIGDRPLMTLGVLLTLMGVQLFSIGFIGEIMRNNYFRAEDEYAIRMTTGFRGSRRG